jgi:hypothetical protein
MLHAAVAFGFVVAALGLVSGLRARRRRFVRGAPLAPALDPLPAGLKHLANRVTELSDLDLHLARPGRAMSRKPRLGALLGLR